MKLQRRFPTYFRTGTMAVGLAALALSGCASNRPTAGTGMPAAPGPAATQGAEASAASAPAVVRGAGGSAVAPGSAAAAGSEVAPGPAPAGAAQAAPAPPAAARAKDAFIAEMAGRGLDPVEVAAVLEQARYSGTVARLVLPPASPTVRSWPRYRARFVESRRIREGIAFQQEYAPVLAQAEARYGVPASIIVSIIGVETFYGRVTGNFRVIDALTTLAFDYPAGARSDRGPFFREQLAHFLTWCKETGTDPLTVKGSYAGAIGLPQFMPGSLRQFAVDGDGDGRIDLLASPSDAIVSVANFLVEHGWQRGQPVFLPVHLPGEPAALVDGGLKPTLNWSQLEAAGARARPVADLPESWTGWPLGVIDLYDGATGNTEYRVAAPNFFALTEYNRSYFYATSVADLAQELERRTRMAGNMSQLNTPVDR
ncbi:MAG: lytic murein transglycosylase B [Pigmentiphaga sp.]|uniref:lytic murein transglycosylase B n=1 Tax=Pigmentiphaga sp. TaxID=1977564 RepID=UPI0029A7CB68|nr:lytic murein transglycosylase B [Pigmentiphaga sp.]MDX3907550.1 lytic murein transglycosylase B [Pigmentiphaga sp.]